MQFCIFRFTIGTFLYYLSAYIQFGIKHIIILTFTDFAVIAVFCNEKII